MAKKPLQDLIEVAITLCPRSLTTGMCATTSAVTTLLLRLYTKSGSLFPPSMTT